MAEYMVDEFGMNFHPIYFTHSRDGVHTYYLTKFLSLMGWNFILQGDEIQKMSLIQDEAMDFQSSNIWIFIKISKKIWNDIFCHKGVDYRVCFSAWDRMEISYHYKMFLVGKFHPLKIELTVYISCPKECSLQGIYQIIFHTTTGWISSSCHART